MTIAQPARTDTSFAAIPCFLVLLWLVASANLAPAATLTWDSDANAVNGATDGGGTWDTGALNWFNGSADVAWPNTTNDIAVIGANSGAAGTNTLSGTITLKGITFNAPGSGNYTLSGGTLSIGGNTPLIAANVGATIASVVSGASGFAKNGAGTLTLSGANTFTGDLVVSNGIVATGAANKRCLGSIDLGTGRVIADGSGSQVQINHVNGFSQNASTEVNRDLVARNGGLVLVAAVNRAGNVTLTNGTVTVNASSSSYGGIYLGPVNGGQQATVTVGGTTASQINGSGNVALDTNTAFDVADVTGDANADLTVSAILILGTSNPNGTAGANSAGFTKTGAGTMAMSGANTYNGVTTLGAGAVQLDAAETAGTSGPLGRSAANNPGSIVFSGGTLRHSVNNLNDYSGRFSTAAGQAYKVDLNGRNVIWATALTSSGGSLTVSDTTGGGRLALTAANTYSGSTLINSGTLALTNSGSIVNSSLISLAGGATLDVSGATVAATLGAGQTLRLSGSTSSATLATAASKGLTLAANSPLEFTAFKPAGSGGAVPLTLSGAGTLSLGTSSPATITVANGGVPLAGGAAYKLIAKGASGSVATAPLGPITVNGDGAVGTPSLVVSNSELYLVLTGASQPTTTAVALTSGTPVYGNNLTFTATVKTNGVTAGDATGQYVFTVNGTPVATNSVAGGSASYTLSNAMAGAQAIKADYLGDAGYNPSTFTLNQPVNPRPVALSGTRGYDGTTNAAAAMLQINNAINGDVVTLVSGSAGLAGAGVGVQPVTSSGTLALGGAQAGRYTTAGATGSVTITNALTQLLLTSTCLPSGSGQPIAFAATIQSAGVTAVAAAGSVTFRTNGVSLASISLTNGVAYSPVTSKLPAGTNVITAWYAGDGNFGGSTNTLNQVVLPVRSTPVTFSNSLLSITIATNGDVSSVKRLDTGAEVLNSSSQGWSINGWIPTNTTTLLNRLAVVATNQLLLWSSDGQYAVNVAITPKGRYTTFELLHVANNLQGGGLDNDWPGHKVSFDLTTYSQGDGWKLNTILLNPMSELNTRWPWHNANGADFHWPYAQWAQTTDRPQPQGAVAVFSFLNDTQHDDILTDIWVGEPSLPRPNTKDVASPFQTWTRADVTAWLDRWVNEQGYPRRTLSFDPSGSLANLYTAANYAYSNGMNRIYLSQHSWQGDNIGKYDGSLFPNGRTDAIAWKQYCDARGIALDFHGFSDLILLTDSDYGRGVIDDDLGRSARGTLLQDVPADATGQTILVQPDLDYYLGMKPGMLPFYLVDQLPAPLGFIDGYGHTFPPYYVLMDSLVSIGRNLYQYTVSMTTNNEWQVVLGARKSTTPLVAHHAGDPVDFILMSPNQNYFVPDGRSGLLVQQAKGYAKLLNEMQTTAGYDGSAWTSDLGSWPLRRFSQEVVERMDHPAGGDSALGIRLFGHFEHQFKRVQNLESRVGNIPVYLWEPAALSPGPDEISHGANGSVVNFRHIGLRGLHSGLTVGELANYGLLDEAGAAMKLWSGLKPYLSTAQMSEIASATNDFFVASETANQWQLTKTRAMLRTGIDGGWNDQPERPDVAPRQFFKANGGQLTGLNNPYATQLPVVELHVMAGMSATNAANISLMPANAGQIINPVNAVQTLGYTSGKLTVAYNNSGSGTEYKYYTKSDTVGYWLKTVDMSSRRGLAITVNGDNSGSTLVVSTGTSFPRCYAVKVDFTGQRTIEIPNGEAVNNLAGWDIFSAGTITQFDYAADVDRFRVWLHKVPAGVNASVEILNIQAMNEDRTTGLINPVLAMTGNSVTVNGTIPYDHYLTYPGNGSTAKVYDPNWNFVTNLTVGGAGLSAGSGNNTFSVNASGSTNTWVSSRLKVAVTSYTIAKPMEVAVTPFPVTVTPGRGSSGDVTNLALSLPTVSGYHYVLQSATNLVAPVIWTSESTNTGTGASLLLNVPVTPGKPQKFVRVRVY